MSAKIYLSPSNQNANKFITGNTNEGAVWNDIATRLQKLLAEYDCETKMAKVTANLATRADEAKAWGADVYIAMHSNAAGVANAGAHGVEVYYDPNKGARTKELAQTLLNELKTLFANRGLRQSTKLIDCYKPAMPSVIGECGFHDNTSDAKTILNNKDKIAQLYCNALVAFLKLKKKGETPSAPAEKPVEEPVETPVEKPAEKPSGTSIAGSAVSLVRAPLYVSATTTTVSSYITGTYYYWDSSVSNGRIRITNAKSRVGVKGQVTGWIASPSAEQVAESQKLTAGQAIKASNMALYYSSTSATATSRISGTYYLWSAAVENNRVRVTNALSRVGVPKQVTGWVNVADITTGTSSTAKKTITEIAKEVIAGKWGNGTERKKKLEAAGYNYSEVQAKVNEMLKK